MIIYIEWVDFNLTINIKEPAAKVRLRSSSDTVHYDVSETVSIDSSFP